MAVHSVLANVTPDQVRLDPYPHFVVDDCLPAAYFQALAANYPSNEVILDYCRSHLDSRFNFVEGTARANDRYDVSAYQAIEHPDLLSDIWLKFIQYHTSSAFFSEVVAVCGDAIRHVYPALEDTIGRPLGAMSTGVRYRSDCDISLDCQIGMNTPAESRSSVRRVHVDAREELFAILLYFRDPADDTEGGNLEICRWKNPRRKRFRRSEVDEVDAELLETVEYKANRMVMFINSQDSLHAVTPRDPSPHTRRLVNIIGEVDKSIPRGLFALPKKKDLDYVRKKIASKRKKLLGV